MVRLVAVWVAALLLLLAACGGTEPAPPEKTLEPLPQGPVIKRNAAFVNPRQCTLSDKLVPSCGVLWGAAVNPRWAKGETWDTAFAAFDERSGRYLDVAHRYYSGDELFPDEGTIASTRTPRGPKLLFLNWKPATDRSFAEVASGAEDDVIDREGAYLAANLDQKFFLTIQHEPEALINTPPGPGYTVEDYRAMFRHVVERLRAQGLTKRMVTVITYRGNPVYAKEPWFEGMYPGDDVVDWIAYDPYVFPFTGYDEGYTKTLDRTIGGPKGWPGFYQWALRTHPGKPLMLGEWGVSQRFDDAKVVALMEDMKVALRTHPQLKALFYWDTKENIHLGRTQMSNEVRDRAFTDLATSTEVTGSPVKR